MDTTDSLEERKGEVKRRIQETGDRNQYPER